MFSKLLKEVNDFSETGPTTNLPVKISGGARNTFTAEFSPREVGSHTISVDYNGMPVTGTPFVCKVYDAKNVYVSQMPTGVLRKNLQFTGNVQFRELVWPITF